MFDIYYQNKLNLGSKVDWKELMSNLPQNKYFEINKPMTINSTKYLIYFYLSIS
jgi:hypothetical protein